MRLLWWLRWKRICLQCGRTGFSPWVRKILWRRELLITPVFLLGEFHGQESLTGSYNIFLLDSEKTKRVNVLTSFLKLISLLLLRSHLVMSDSGRPHRWQHTRLPRPWNSPGKNAGVGCHFLLQCMKVKSEIEASQSCLTLSDPMDCNLPGSSIHGIFQARVLEWLAIAFS